MGNYISCALSSSHTIKNSKSTTKIIFPTGEIRQICEPIKAAELMLESPNFFLVNANSLQMGRRFSALSADEDVEMGNAYVMFPMKRVNSVVTAADMGALFLKAKRVAVGNNAKILPETITYPVAETKGEVATMMNLEDAGDFSFLETKHRLSMCRSKKPLLETIEEEPALLR